LTSQPSTPLPVNQSINQSITDCTAVSCTLALSLQ